VSAECKEGNCGKVIHQIYTHVYFTCISHIFTATHCNTASDHCNTLQHSLTSNIHTCIFTSITRRMLHSRNPPNRKTRIPRYSLEFTATHCNTASNSLQHTATQPRIPRYSLAFDQNFMLLHRTQWSYICIHIYAYIYMNSTRYTSYTMEHSIVHNAAHATQFADAYRTQLQKLL